ncbi:Gfo/Idh/MocA family oxidoreductase [Chlorobium phaeovibrioides]|uniref:Gfo/Idh/MocA family protein n=1 Tax=Chlorobium phaeovibrioides TaxID=1094 RepID=UPI000F837284|nr:Gfo/Idh/MocA family oxidoreductase [Chlorobium phaeovibrioides]RTY34150.1 Gfo/Idh/MocA family oxidoreductase [Chlorobium phaeovibrioides]
MAGRRVLVCGAGSIGRRHITNLLSLGVEVSVWRARSGLLNEVAQEFPVKVFEDLSIAISEAEAVVVATATDQHVAIATEALKAGKALFIEKPISHDWLGVDRLSSLVEGKIVEVGCQFRAHPNLIALDQKLCKTEEGRSLTYRLAMGQRLDAWRPAQDYQAGYSADSSRGGGALFDLIHQIDIALWFFGPVVGVYAVLDNIGDLNIKGDDVTNLLLTHKSGVTGHIQLDMASPVYRCEVEVMTSNALINWSNAQGVLQQRKADGIPIIVDSVPDGFVRNDLFLIHIAHFLKRIDNPLIPPLCAFEDGVAALKVALGARKSNLLRKMVTI